jgi:aminoglycoside phosphotransferase (APT) family kinase protein
LNQNTIDELLDAIRSGRIERKDQGKHPGAHSEPFFYRTSGGEDYVLLRAKEKHLVGGFRKQQVLYPFLLTQNLPVRTARIYEIIECDDDTYAVMERFFGRGHGPDRYKNAPAEQQARIVKQIARFFFRLHSIPVESLPTGIDYVPYFKYDKSLSTEEDVFLHADFNYSNFLVDDDYNLHAVFDWHPACVGPRVAEFAAFIYCNDKEFLPIVLDEYNAIAGTSITPEQVVQHFASRR